MEAEFLDELESLVFPAGGRYRRGWIRVAIVEAARQELAGEIRRILDDVPDLERIESARAWLQAWHRAARRRAECEAKARPSRDPMIERRQLLGFE